jgi:undecaprenyl-diphosphatase
MSFNQDLFYAIFSQSGKSGTLDALMIFGADYLVFAIVFIIILAFFMGGEKEKRAFFLTILGGILTMLVIQIIHQFIQIPRPFIEYSIKPLINLNSGMVSFPSTHTSLSAVIASAFLLNKSKLAVFLIMAMLFVGFCRIYVGVHYPIDIFGGIVLGFVITYFTFLITNKLFKKF